MGGRPYANLTCPPQVRNFVRPFEEDGRDFIKAAPLRVWGNPFPETGPKISKSQAKKEKRAFISGGSRVTTPASTSESALASSVSIPQSKLRRQISHFVMNLPDSAIEFLDAFRGIFAEPELREAYEERLPMVHCHCFTREFEDQTRAEGDIKQVSTASVMGVIRPEKANFRLKRGWKRDWGMLWTTGRRFTLFGRSHLERTCTA